MRKSSSFLLAAALLAGSFAAQAGNRGDAIIGSVIGGATGAVIGNNLGGRDGAIVGGAIGAAAGVAIATDRNSRSGHSAHDDHRYTNHYNRYDQYDRYDRRDDRRYDRHREVVVIESPRHYYQGNEFVYGVPPRHDNGRHRGWDHHRHGRGRDRGPEVIIIQPYPRYERHERSYYVAPRRW